MSCLCEKSIIKRQINTSKDIKHEVKKQIMSSSQIKVKNTKATRTIERLLCSRATSSEMSSVMKMLQGLSIVIYFKILCVFYYSLQREIECNARHKVLIEKVKKISNSSIKLIKISFLCREK